MGVFLVLAVAALIYFPPQSQPVPSPGEPQPLSVFVSILPQKFFLEKIGGDLVQVSVLVGPGQSPATYEPLPQQMAALAQAPLYFRLGVPFESVWLSQIQGLNPALEVVDTRRGIELRAIDGAREGEARGLKDPHIWLDPLLVKLQARTMAEKLVEYDPQNAPFYWANLASFSQELEELHQELGATFETLKTGQLLVFHPAWGYLLDRYQIEQIPIEVEGKEPGPRALAELIERAQAEGIQVVFAEEQSDPQTASAVARAIGGRVVKLDPLAEDYLNNLRQIAQVIAKEH